MPQPTENDTLGTSSSSQTCETADFRNIFKKRKSSGGDINDISKRCHPADPRHLNRPGITPLQNKFAPLSELDEDITDDPNQTSTSKQHKPPPIHLTTEVQFLPLCTQLKSLVGDEFTCKSTLKGITVYPTTSDAYRKIVRAFKDCNARYHTYQLEDDKAFRIVIRGLHYSIDTDSIKEELQNKGHRVRSVVNALSWQKTPLPLFFVDLEKDPSNASAFGISTLCYSRVKVEPPRLKRKLPQCTRCQQYGHTKHYCNHQARCVKCPGHHLTSECTKPKDTAATCVLCGQNHPANYKGCSIYKELSLRRTPRESSHVTLNPRPVPAVGSFVNSEQSFPPLPRSSLGHGEHEVQVPIIQRPHRQPSTSYSHAAQQIPHPHGDTHHYETYTHNPVMLDQLSSFVSEMKSLITPMLTLMSQLMSVLLKQNGSK